MRRADCVGLGPASDLGIARGRLTTPSRWYTDGTQLEGAEIRQCGTPERRLDDKFRKPSVLTRGDEWLCVEIVHV